MGISHPDLKSKYLQAIRNISTTSELRNKAAHETNSDFARLLVDEEFIEGPLGFEAQYWAPVLTYVYRDKDGKGLSTEDCAKLEEEQLATFLPKGPDEKIVK
ncbi:MAG: hypothetical protein Q9219_001251 [cf. Caloplaca sp. 3 TL-2023]